MWVKYSRLLRWVADLFFYSSRKHDAVAVGGQLLVGVTAGLGMYVYATLQHGPQDQHAASPLVLAFVVLSAMTVSCVAAGLAGAAIPLVLRRLGADPSTASAIFLTTATDIASMGIFLTLATILLF